MGSSPLIMVNIANTASYLVLKVDLHILTPRLMTFQKGVGERNQTRAKMYKEDGEVSS